MLIPKLAVNPSKFLPEECYQISNISEDKQHYDFLGFKQISVNNIWAANIVRDRTDLDYYKNLDFDLTSDDLDKADIQCIAEGMNTDIEMLPSSRPEQKPLSWDEFNEKESDDMTAEEIDQYVLSTYGLTFKDVMTDREILAKHAFILEQYEKIKAEEANVQADVQMNIEDNVSEPAENLPDISADTQSLVDIQPSADIPVEPSSVQELDSDIIEELAQQDSVDHEMTCSENQEQPAANSFLVKCFGDYTEKNCSSFNKFCQALLGNEYDEIMKKKLKSIVMETMQEFNMPPVNKKIYDGVLSKTIDKGNSLGLFKKRYVNRMVLAALEKAKQ